MYSRRRVAGLVLPLAAIFMIACGVEGEGPAAAPNFVPRTSIDADATPEPGSTRVEEQDARIESISIIVLESDPPQYVANVTVLQPDSCATFGHVQARHEPGTTKIELAARNEVLVGEGVACDEAISTFEQPVPLGIDFEPGVTYTVAGGGASTTFTPQGEPPFYSYDRFFAELDSLVGATEAGEVAQPFSSVVPRLVQMGGGTIQVFEFETIADAIEMVVRVENSPVIDWIDTPHFFRRGNVVVLYVGQDQGVLKAISAVTRSEFKRPFEPDSPPEVVEPDPTPTPPPPGGHRLFIKVIPEGNGFRFVGELIGGADNEKSLYCVGSTWLLGDGLGVTAMPGCIEYTADTEITRHYEFSHTYDETGEYEVVLKVGPLTSAPSVVIAGTANDVAPTPSSSDAAPVQAPEMVWPVLLSVDPIMAAPGQQVALVGQGGYLYSPETGYDESARGFELLFDGEVAGELSCYVNRCEGSVTVPTTASAGGHSIIVEGGSEIELDVRG